MQTYLVTTTHQAAEQLLKDLEAIGVISLAPYREDPPKGPSLAQKMQGSLSVEEAGDLQKQVQQMRDEWEERLQKQC